jgi:Rrf2 family nitric oxide-sensitive transcriptional repressor
MRLTVHTDYALRVLMYLAVRPTERPTIAGVAASYGISRNHLMKVAHELGRRGYIETLRGKGGGLALARRPEEIVLGDVVRCTEPDFALVPCFDPVGAACAISPVCRLRGALGQAQSAFLRVLDGYTLADLVANRGALAAALLEAKPEIQEA